MQHQQKLEDFGYAPSFSCYSSDSSKTSTAIAKVIHEETFHEIVDDFEFSLSSDEDVSVKQTDSRDWTVFNLEVNVDEDRGIKATENEIYASSAVTSSLQKLFIGEPEESSSSSSSYSSSAAVDELENRRHLRSYCVWKPKAETTWKKSNSTGSSGSKRYRIFRYLLRRSNSEGTKPMVLLSSKKVDSPKLKGKSSEVLKAQSPEQFYVQRRAQNKAAKRKSYLPYRTDMVGFFANANGMGKMLPF